MKKRIVLLASALLCAQSAFAGWSSGGGGPPPAASEGLEKDPTVIIKPARPGIKIELTDDEMTEKLIEALSNPIKPKPIQIEVNGRLIPFKPKTLDFNARTMILTAPTGEDVTLKKTEEMISEEN